MKRIYKKAPQKNIRENELNKYTIESDRNVTIYAAIERK